MSDSPSPIPDLHTVARLLPQLAFEAPMNEGEDPVIFKARQRALDREVAVTVWSSARSADPVFRSSIETGAKQMARLNHPNLITVFDSGTAGQLFYQVSEYVHGKTLARSSEGKAIEPSTAIALAAGICEGIQYAHKHGVVHGALTRSSVLLTPDVTPKIAGFGTRDATTVTPKDDVRAIGAILYELLTGRLHSGGAPPPSGICGCNPALDEIVRKAIDANGYKDAVSLQAALAEIKNGKSSRALRAATPHPAADPRPAAPAPMPSGTPSGGHLVRNLFIIAALLVAIYFVWGELQKAQSERDRQNKETAAANDEARSKALAEAERKRRERAEEMRKQQAGSSGTATDEEDTAASIARLRDRLASGDRREMPAGARPSGESFFVFIGRPMTWPDADRYARDLGGHLATPGAGTDLDWLAQLAPDNGRCWIGAGRSGRSEWSLCDGKPWKPTTPPAGIGPFVSLSNHGTVRAHRPDEKLGFLVEWHMDGSNPGGLEERLATTGNSIASKQMIFPPGTRRFGNRLFLAIHDDVDWKSAKKLARSAGGHLAALTDPDEMHAVEDLTSGIDQPAAFWLAGFRDGNEWRWETGETWKSARWAENRGEAGADSALAIAPDTGWIPLDRSSATAGFIIEWSSDARKPPTATGNEESPAAEIAALTAKARSLLATLEKDRAAALEKNAKTFTWDLSGWRRNLSSTQEDEWGEHVQKLLSSVKNNRVPASVPEDSGVLLSEKMASIASYAARKQGEIDSKFAEDARKIRDAFVPRLESAARDAHTAGQTALAETIRDQISLAADLDGWTRSLGTELEPENPVLKAPKKRFRNAAANRPQPRPGTRKNLIE